MNDKDFQIKQNEMLMQNDVPAKYHAGLKSYAWQEGHANGYGEVLNTLKDLIDHIFRNW